MSVFNSVLGSLSPQFRSSFEDPHERDHELPLYHAPTSPRVPPPIASTVLWNASDKLLSSQPRVPDELLAIQRRARHLEAQLQELLDAQASGLSNGPAGNNPTEDDSVSNLSATPTVSVKGHENGSRSRAPKKTIGVNAARRGIFKRIQQLALVKAEEMEILDEDLTELESILEKTSRWSQKRSRLEKRIQQIEGETSGARAKALHDEASRLEQEIRQKEEELWALKGQHRRILAELADTENTVGAKLSSYKESLSILNKEVTGFLARPPGSKHVPRSSSPFLSLPLKRRTLAMAHEYWRDEHQLLAEHCQEVDRDRAALDEGAVLWGDVMEKVTEFETALQEQMQRAAADPSQLLARMEETTAYLEQKTEVANSRGWNLLVCAIGAELDAFRQGRELLERTLGTTRKGKEKVGGLVDTESPSNTASEHEDSSPARRTSPSPPKSPATSSPRYFDRHDEDPDPELLISHRDTDTD